MALGVFLIAVTIVDAQSVVRSSSRLAAITRFFFGNTTAALSGPLVADVTPQTSGTAIATVYTLQSYTLPANTLVHDGDAVYIEAFMTTAANANSKDFYIQFGGVTVAAHSGTVASNTSFIQTARITRTGAGAQLARGWSQFNGSTPVLIFTPLTAAETGAIVIATQCQNNAAAAACGTSKILKVIAEPAPIPG